MSNKKVKKPVSVPEPTIVPVYLWTNGGTKVLAIKNTGKVVK